MPRRRRTAKKPPAAPAPAAASAAAAATDRAREARTREIQSVVQQTLKQLYGGKAAQRVERREDRKEQRLPPPKAAKRQAPPKAPTTPKTPLPKVVKETVAPLPVIRRGHSAIPRGNYAFVDGTNLNVSIRHMGWSMDWEKFRTHLREEHNVTKAYYFLGYLEANEEIYEALRAAGFELVFKPTLVTRDGTVKGNVDAELVLQAMIDLTAYDRAVVVTGDGDFASLINHLRRIGKLHAVLVPNSKRYSSLIKAEADDDLVFIDRLRAKLSYKAPRATKG